MHNGHVFDCWFHAVRAILLRTWDPLHVARYPLAIDEYDEYARAIVNLLWSNPTEGALGEYLELVERDRMHLGEGDPTKRRAVARELLALDRSHLTPR